ncbi:hypothetical protein ACIRL2_41385 [Embleya sp. NPDC127516]|uniref:hypothetical protein n=1 Tax=Embleya sp. NPDC127516 TaxID=3363990 RepID=UPI0038119A8B
MDALWEETKAAGLNPTTGRKRGKKPEKLRKQSGHSANSPVFWSYVEDGEMWEDAATEGLGL